MVVELQHTVVVLDAQLQYMVVALVFPQHHIEVEWVLILQPECNVQMDYQYNILNRYKQHYD